MDSKQIWQKMLDEIKNQITSHNYRTWFGQTKLVSLENSNLTLAVPSAFVKGQLIARYENLMEEAGLNVFGKKLAITYRIDPSIVPSKQTSEQFENDLFQIRSPISQPTSPLNPKYSLENFVVGPTNNLAYAAAQAVVQNPGVSYNPLFIYGESGVGKTHLMQAIGNSLLSKNPYLKTIFASSERFMNDFIESIRNKKTGDFRSKYRSCDILLIDDVQFLSGKDSTQEEFFHTFNDLHTKNCQVVLTSDRIPNEIQKLEPRLASRFQGGLMVDIQLPDFETRVAILKAKLSEKNEILPEDCLNIIAETIQNTRELEGKLIQIIQMLKLKNQAPSLEMVRQFLGKQSTTTIQKVDYKKLLSGINLYFNLKMHDLIGPRRQKELVMPRQIAMYLMYLDCKMPMEKIGQILGGRDHTTILHGIKKIEAATSRDREVQRLLIEIKQQLSGQ